MKTTNISKTKQNETKAWFRSPFAPSGQEMDQTYSATPGDRTWLFILVHSDIVMMQLMLLVGWSLVREADVL